MSSLLNDHQRILLKQGDVSALAVGIISNLNFWISYQLCLNHKKKPILVHSLIKKRILKGTKVKKETKDCAIKWIYHWSRVNHDLENH